jgi:hypothetical protein
MKKIFLPLLLLVSASVLANWQYPQYNPDGEAKDYGNHLDEYHQLRKTGDYASDDTLRYYFDRQLWDHDLNFQKYDVQPTGEVIPLEKDLQNFNDVTEELKYTGLVSYLFYEDGKIKVDKKSPDDRFGNMFNDNTAFIANSIGKSMVSYTLGHAICAGHISGIEERLDYPHLKNTLYDNQRLVDLMTFKTGDQDYHSKKVNVWNYSVFDRGLELKGTGSSSNKKHNYNGFVPHIVINYIMSKFESEEEYKEFLKTVFPGMENEVWFVKSIKQWKEEDDWTDGWSKASFHASRYDYLRIAKSMLDHWNKNTCVGQYLKDIYENREHKGYDVIKAASRDFVHGSTNEYGGFFHFDYDGYWGSPIVFVMDGYGGQMIWINMDDNRIIVTNAIHSSYDWKNIVAGVVKNGLD